MLEMLFIQFHTYTRSLLYLKNLRRYNAGIFGISVQICIYTSSTQKSLEKIGLANALATEEPVLTTHLSEKYTFETLEVIS